MPRPIIGLPQPANSSTVRPRPEPQTRVRSGMPAPQLAQLLRRKRSREYVGALKALDAGTYQSNREALTSLLEAISKEFPELGVDQLPLGIVAVCHLDSPFEVHVCGTNGEIIEHYETFRPMPAPSSARRLALHPAYAFVEVYADALRAVAQDGSVSLIESC